MTRYLLGIVSVVAFSGLAVAGPADLFEEKEKDFGISPKGTTLVHYFRFTNNTKDTITPRSTARLLRAASRQLSLATRSHRAETAASSQYMDTRRIQYAGVTKTVTVFVPFLTPTAEEVSLKVTV